MRSMFLVLLSCLLIMPGFSQVPNQEEVDAQMKQLVNELKKEIAEIEEQIKVAKKENPEEVKHLVEQVNIMKKQLETMGSFGKIFESMEDDTRQKAPIQEVKKKSLPKRDERRIKALPKKVLTDAELVGHVNKVHAEVERLLSKYKADALKIYNASKAKNNSSDYMSNVASSLWMVGYPELALLILGRECVADPKNSNNLNNYAAFLTMANGEHAALPILQSLDQRYPNNSTILNNIAHAYYGLGDIDSTNKHLDRAIGFYRRHAQANLTKSSIAQSEGKTKEAIQSLKQSIKEHHTAEKEALLVELGGALEYDDVLFAYPIKAEPLGFEKFILIMPEYPLEGGIAAEILLDQWDDYRKQLRSTGMKLSNKMTALKSQMDAYNARILANPMMLKPYMSSPVYQTADRKMALLMEWFVEQRLRIEKQILSSKDTVELWKEEYDKVIQEINEAHKNDEDRTVACNKAKTAATAFLRKANALWQQRNSEFLTLHKQYLNTRANLTLYTSYDRSIYEYMIADIERTFVEELANINVRYETGCVPKEVPHQGLTKPLPDFDELTCEFKDEIFIPPFTTIKTECNKMSTEFDVDTELGVKVKVGWEEDLNRGKITKGTLELGVEEGIDGDVGPIAAELKAGGAIGIEVTETGIKEAYIKAGVSTELSSSVEEPMTPKGSEISKMELKSSWNAGSNGKEGSIVTDVSGEALLKNIDWATPQIKSK